MSVVADHVARFFVFANEFFSNIIPKINAITTRSQDTTKSCNEFKNVLEKGYVKRERLILKCVGVWDKEICK